MSKWRPISKPGGCIFVIPDIHGCADQLKLILNRITPLRPQDKLIFLGDYIDRGDSSYEVIEILISLRSKYTKNNVIFLRGNHEELLLNSLGLGPKGTQFTLNQVSDYSMWINNGGEDTIINYAKQKGIEIKNPKELPSHRCLSFIDKKHIDFIQNETQLYYELDNYIFVHASYDINIPTNQQDSSTLLWDRTLYSSVKSIISQGKKLPWEQIIIAGHNFDGPFISDKFLMLDASSKGILLVVELNSMEAFSATYGHDRLVKYTLEEAKPKKAVFRRVENL
jgi:serine/threonine protein phosphatase 1